jgi:outer membrane lipoprotein carrier protein
LLPGHSVDTSQRKPGPSSLVALLGFFLLLPATLHAQTAEQLAQRVDKYYNTLHSLRVSFTETFRGMGMNRQESGTLLLRKPGKMHWSYAHPAGKTFLLDGKYAWFYSPGDAQVERVAASQLDDLRSPLRFLLGHTQLQRELTGLSLATTAEGMELSGVPKGMENRVQKILLGVNADGVIHSMQILETDGAVTAFTFTDSVPNSPAPDAEFVFHAPEGVPVIDGLPPI